jgi:flagellar biosynthetic protein FliR
MFERMLGFVLVLTRISAFFLVLPIYGAKVIPVQIKVAAAILLSLFFYYITPVPAGLREASFPTAVLLTAGEAMYGLALGLIIAMLFAVVQLSTRMVEQQMGLTMMEILDPMSEDEGSSLGSLMEMIFTLLLLTANGHHLFLLTLSKSYQALPAGAKPSLSLLTSGVIGAGTAMFLASLRLAVPMLAAMLILMVALALLARLVPEMNILFVSMPARLLLGLFLIVTFLPFVNTFVAEMADWMTKLLPI